ncbi:MAG: 16S rRNA (cytosine(1402)-N(4))-methyltransferase RsmH [Candidatus Eremiobacteraeota bacterium]|nr:16S rRNA (cytosine(1402)-N(4))-methyltransferase RsmH [Candidatus Eremiobacteraeota bacterium]MBV9408586.1 16S rRNA (cytosine(1402)-N(4))-methyltransferase RsmH [Candidatus Eremiobacteraeota bacterium]
MPAHVPVLAAEAVEALAIRADGVYADATFGAGGHAALILERLGPAGRLIAFDADPSARERALSDPRFTLLHANFRELAARLDLLGIARVDGVLFDLGVSSMQFDEGERGFSFRVAAPLDMRMDPTRGESAADWLASRDEREIADVIYQYGEERHSRRIARSIVALRDAGTPVRDTADLAGVVARAVRAPVHTRIHPATRTFQALRIAVNDELGALREGLGAALDRTVPGGRVTVISFHSLEDRIVKHTFREDPRARAVTRKPIVAGDDELVVNPRARSAKLRVAEVVEVTA